MPVRIALPFRRPPVSDHCAFPRCSSPAAFVVQLAGEREGQRYCVHCTNNARAAAALMHLPIMYQAIAPSASPSLCARKAVDNGCT